MFNSYWLLGKAVQLRGQAEKLKYVDPDLYNEVLQRTNMAAGAIGWGLAPMGFSAANLFELEQKIFRAEGQISTGAFFDDEEDEEEENGDECDE